MQIEKDTEHLMSELRSGLSEHSWPHLRDICLRAEPSVLADVVPELDDSELAIIFRILPRKLTTKLFEYLDLDTQKRLLKGLAQEHVASLLNEMSPDDRTALLEELPGPVVMALMALLTPSERQVAQSLLGYPEDSVGRLMTPDYIAIKAEWTVQEVLRYIRRHGHEKESLNVLYVTNETGHLVDDIRIKDILLSDPDVTIRTLMNDAVVFLNVTDDKEISVSLFRKYDRVVLPVCDSEGFLLGIVTIDDVLDIVEETDTREIQQFGGLEALNEAYMQVSFWQLLRKRAKWLVVLFLGELLTASAMAFFEDELAKAVVLALFVPLIISSGGNSGSQAATLIIRAMALNEITIKDWKAVFLKESISGLILGVLLGSMGMIRILLFGYVGNMYGDHTLLIGLTVFLTLVGVVLWGTITGAMLPFILRRFRIDPATSSAPFVATIVDVTGLLIYFSIAAFILHGTLL
jgi:magnesium transporter